MQKNIFGTICGMLFLLTASLSTQNIVKDKDHPSSGRSAAQKEAEAALKTPQKASGKIALLDTLKVSSKTRIIGKCFDHNNPYDIYSFLLNDSASIVQFAKSLKAGKKMMSRIYGPEFNICIVNDYLQSNHIAINPFLNSIRINGNTYEFDFAPIKKIHKKHPLICDEQKEEFNNENEANNYIDEIKKDTNLLYYIAPEFKYEGAFTISVKKSAQFNNPKAVMDYLTPHIETIVSKGEYQIFYSIDLTQLDKELQSNDYTITISGSKKLFENLNINEFKKDNWKYAGKQVGLFYIKR